MTSLSGTEGVLVCCSSAEDADVRLVSQHVLAEWRAAGTLVTSALQLDEASASEYAEATVGVLKTLITCGKLLEVDRNVSAPHANLPQQVQRWQKRHQAEVEAAVREAERGRAALSAVCVRL